VYLFGVHLLARARLGIVGDSFGKLVVPDVTVLNPLYVRVLAMDDDATLHGGCVRHRGIRRLLERDLPPLAPAGVLSDQHLTLHVVHPAGQRVGGEPPKTTVCVAPSRVQASIAAGSSGTIPI